MTLDNAELERMVRATIERLLETEARESELTRRLDELIAWAMSSDRPPAFTGTRIQQLEAALALANQRIKGDPGPAGRPGAPGLDGLPGPPGKDAAMVIREVKISG